MLIQSLIAQGKTDEALLLLSEQTTEAALLQARFNSSKRQYNMGLIGFENWSRVQAQINYSVLDLAERLPKIAVVSQTVVFNYFNYERQPGNDVGLVNKIFRTLKTMVEDMEYPEADLVKGVEMLNDIFGLCSISSSLFL